MTHEVLEQLEFATSELQRHIAAGDSPAEDIDLEIRHSESQRLSPAASPHEGANARDQFRKGERLHEIVVGAGLESQHAVLYSVTRSQDEHWRMDAAVT
jgi:hypothetical protein